MPILKTCENCVYYDKEYEHEYCYSCYDNFFVPKEEVIRQDEREKVFEKLSKYCQEENVKYGFQHNGNDYTITKNGYIDTFAESIRQDERRKVLKILEEDDIAYKELVSDDLKNNYLANITTNNAVREYITDLIELLKEE